MVMGAKVFTATKAKDREELGEVVTRWIQGQSAGADPRQDRDPELGQRIPLPVDHDFLRAVAAVALIRRCVSASCSSAASPKRESWRPSWRRCCAGRGCTLLALAEDASGRPGRHGGRRRSPGRVDRRAGRAGRRRDVPLRRGAGRRSRRADVRRQPGQPGLHHPLRPRRGGRRRSRRPPPAGCSIEERMRLAVTHPPAGGQPGRRSGAQRRQRRRPDPALDRPAAGSGGAARRRRDRHLQGRRADRRRRPPARRPTRWRRAGPILTPDVQAMVLTPICPHTLTNRPLVFRPDARLEIRNVSGGPVTLTIDGQWGHELAHAALDRGAARPSARCASTGRHAASSACSARSSPGASARCGSRRRRTAQDCCNARPVSR